MEHMQGNNKRVTNRKLPSYFNDALVVSFVIIIISSILFYFTFYFDEVPKILNRGMQPATFPKGLLIIIISLTSFIYLFSLKNPWKEQEALPKTFYYTFITLIFFVIIAKTLDFFLGLSVFSFIVSYLWGERRKLLLFFVAVAFPLLVFLFFETILNLRFPGGILTDLYYR
jgi:putative tricarboxylic transport membrane protein